MYIYIYIYINAVVLLSSPSLAFSSDIIWSKFVLKTVCQKHCKNWGFNTCKKLRANISGVIIWSLKLAMFKMHKLGPDSDTYLDQRMIPQKGFFLKMCRNKYFNGVFDINQILAPKKAPKTITFTFCKQKKGLFKNVLLQPPSWPKIGDPCSPNIDAEQQTQLKIKKNTKIRKQVLKNKQKTKNNKKWWKNLSNVMFWCCSFMK